MIDNRPADLHDCLNFREMFSMDSIVLLIKFSL